MGRTTRVSVSCRRALNQAMLHAGRVPAGATLHPGVLVRSLRSALRMSQADLALRAGVEQVHISHLERGRIDVRWGTLRRLLDAMFCDLLILPRARQRPADALAEREIDTPGGRRVWEA